MALACTVLGAGSWGTSLAIQLARQGHDVVLWDRNPDRCEVINREHRNPRYLTSVALPPSLRAEPDIEVATRRASLLVPVVPSHALREVMTSCVSFLPDEVSICCATKGIELTSLQTMDWVLLEVLPEKYHPSVTVLSGPSFALELAKGLPTAVVIGGADEATHMACEAFHGGGFRAYHTEDRVGLCVGGSVKNVMAIACGISDGVGLGANARAGIITRGLAEITRLATALGANPLTMMGLGGLGDLVLTCTGNLSRNRRVGLGLGKGQKLPEILEELGEVAEGVRTAVSARDLSRQLSVEMPITEQVYALLHEDKPAAEGLQDLLRRERRAERD